MSEVNINTVTETYTVTVSNLVEQHPPREVLKEVPMSHKKLTSHHHLDVKVEILEATATPEIYFKRERHKSSDLAMLASDFANREPLEMCQWQKVAIDNFDREKASPNSIYGIDAGTAEDIDVIRGYFEFFDTLFFFGCLRSVMTCHLVDEVEDGYAYEAFDILRRPNPPTSPKETPVIEQCLVEIKILQQEDRRTRLTFYLGIVLHQMCHAFLTIYSCRMRNCHEKRENAGKDGHGKAWDVLAVAVDWGARRNLGLSLQP